MNRPSRKQKAQFAMFLGIIITTMLILAGTTIFSMLHRFSNQKHVKRTPRVSQTINKNDQTHETIHNYPTQAQATTAYNAVANELGTTGTYNQHGAYILNNNKAQIKLPKSPHEFAANTVDKQGRPTVANAFLTKHSRQYKNREQTNNGSNDWKPQGYQQKSNLPGKYKYAYNRGHLLGYALVGNIHGFDASEHNKKNIITQTMWANQARTENNTGQNYYEGLVRKALDQNKQVLYQVKPLYGKNNTTNKVPYGVQIQALSTDGSLNFNVFVPNIQGNINIDYTTGQVTINNN